MKSAARVLLAAALSASAACELRPPAPRGDGARLRLLPDAKASGFAQALVPRPFVLPADHGPHFDYQTEWWYYTGNLSTQAGRRFGFQLTLFRRGLTPQAPPAAGLATNQIYFAHFALTDVAAGRHLFSERFARGAGGLAGAEGTPYQVWIEDWTVTALDADGRRVRLRARDGDQALELTLEAEKPLVAHGERGLSRKSAEPGNASYYVGYTRLRAQGRVTVAGVVHDVLGEAWFDHEWSTSALGPGAVGWDWFSLQLSDRRELMYFQLRRQDGTLEPVSGGTLVEADGSTRYVRLADVQLDPLGQWTSPETGARYPGSWRLRIAAAQLDLEVRPWTPAQEMRTSFTYWEGAVQVQGTSAGQNVSGQGYVELTGYAATMKGVF